MKIGLALSGGGTRAAVFHLGVLRRLAEEKKLEEVSKISTVSGGSLLVAAIFSKNDNKWPTSETFLKKIYPEMKSVLATIDLFSPIDLAKFFFPHPLLTLFQRSRLVAKLLEKRWHVYGDFRELPDYPLWVVNATSVETGKNWRFTKKHMGDWKFGHYYKPAIKLSVAAASSAAVPYALNALKLPIPNEGWFQIDPSTTIPGKVKKPPLSSVRLWDGGAYENLAIEAMWKPDRGLIDCDFLIVSDASAPLSARWDKSNSSSLSQLNSPRLFDVVTDQIRALRSRMLVDAMKVKKDGLEGVLIRMGNTVKRIDKNLDCPRSNDEYEYFQNDGEAQAAINYPTSLQKIPETDFNIIARNGFEATEAILTGYHPSKFNKGFRWNI